MPTLTYPYLGPDAADLVGQVLGADSTGWPWRVEAVAHTICPYCDLTDERCALAATFPELAVKCCPDCTHWTAVTVEPWPLSAPGDSEGARRLGHAHAAVTVSRPAEIPRRPTTTERTP